MLYLGCCPKCGNGKYMIMCAGQPVLACPNCKEEESSITLDTSDPNMFSIEPALKEANRRAEFGDSIFGPSQEHLLRQTIARLEEECAEWRRRAERAESKLGPHLSENYSADDRFFDEEYR